MMQHIELKAHLADHSCSIAVRCCSATAAAAIVQPARTKEGSLRPLTEVSCLNCDSRGLSAECKGGSLLTAATMRGAGQDATVPRRVPVVRKQARLQAIQQDCEWAVSLGAGV